MLIHAPLHTTSAQHHEVSCDCHCSMLMVDLNTSSVPPTAKSYHTARIACLPLRLQFCVREVDRTTGGSESRF